MVESFSFVSYAAPDSVFEPPRMPLGVQLKQHSLRQNSFITPFFPNTLLKRTSC